MRLGGQVFVNGTDPEEYALAHVQKGFGAAICPEWVSLEKPKELKAFRDAMQKYDIRIAEVGAWCNPMSQDPAEAEKNICYMIERLRLAEELGAATCVNILGTKYDKFWYGAHRAGYEKAFFEEAVSVSQRIIDTVQPIKTTLSFEMMPYYFLDSAKEYQRFLKAVDRDAVAVHLDICNTMNEPRRFYDNENFIRETFSIIGDRIVTLHLKDIALEEDALTVRFQEVLVGTGGIAYETMMEEIAKMPVDTPAMLEHLATEEQYDAATAAIERFAIRAGMHREGMIWF